MPEFPLASNPWAEGQLPSNQPPLTLNDDGEFSKPMTPEDAYRSMCSFLNSWSGTATVDLDHEERHTRFVQIVGGYPLINNRFPLDWPLHPGSSKALRLSLFLDSIQVHKDISLRTYILEMDLAHRVNVKHGKGIKDKKDMNKTELKGYLKEWANVNKTCVGALIAALRNNEDLQHPYHAIEEAFLLSLHSSESDQLSCWPDKLESPKLDESYFIRRPGGEPPKPDEYNEIPQLKKKGEPYEHLVDWSIFNNSPAGSRKEVNFELKYIQTWMKKRWLKHWLSDRIGKLNDSVGQRFVRGLSVICEATMASIRQKVIEKYGVGSIVIDGGGRLSISVPGEKADDARNLMVEGFEETFGVGKKRPYFLSQEINEAFNAHVSVDERKDAHEEYGRDGLETLRKECHGADFIRQNLPPYRCYVVNDRDFDEEHIPELLTSKKSPCKICDEELGDGGWRSLVGKLRNDPKFCFMHRLAFFVGTNQRKRDSILRLSYSVPMGLPVGPAQINRQSLRAVEQICMIDANSVGYIFCHNRDSICDEAIPGQVLDVRRRRSFRYNALWYISLANALQSTRSFGSDRIAAWVCAGDDLILAQYGGRLSKNLQNSHGGKKDPMHIFLENFDSELQANFSETTLAVTFAGGGHSRFSRTNSGLNRTFKAAMISQKLAKLEWKSRVKNLQLQFEVDYLQTLSPSGDLESKIFERLGKKYWCRKGENLFTDMSSSDSSPRSLYRQAPDNAWKTNNDEQGDGHDVDYFAYGDVEIQCGHDECGASYPLRGPAKHLIKCPEKKNKRKFILKKSKKDKPEEHPLSYEEYLELGPNGEEE